MDDDRNWEIYQTVCVFQGHDLEIEHTHVEDGFRAVAFICDICGVKRILFIEGEPSSEAQPGQEER